MRRWIALGLAAMGLLPASATASSYVMVSDRTLERDAGLVSVARAVGADSYSVGGVPWTRYSFAVERRLKGEAAARIEVDVPGGIASGLGMRIEGMPEFRRGERALLFLTSSNRGAFRLAHDMLGAFRVYDTGRRTVAVRELDDSLEVTRDLTGDRSRFHRPRDLGRFAAWLRGGREGRDDYFVTLDDSEREAIRRVSSATPRFTLLKSSRGLPFRWDRFEDGEFEDWRIHEEGQPGLPGEGGDPAGASGLIEGIQAWVDAPDSEVLFQFAGSTAAPTLEASADSVLFFQDRLDSIAEDFSCAEGGVLATGGATFFISQTRRHKGLDFHRAVKGFINMNRGIGCIFSGSGAQANFTEIVAHELGHALGLGHSCGDSLSPACGPNPVLDEALMRARAHLDARGPALNADDRAGISFLYGAALAGPRQQTSYFAQVADGRQPTSPDRFTTRMVFHNSGGDASIRIDFFNSAGEPVTLNLEGLGSGASFEVDLASGESLVAETPGTGPLRVGYARLIAPPGVDGTAVFTRFRGELALNQAAVPSSQAGRDFSLVFDARDANATALALAYPSTGGGQPAADVLLRLYDDGFNLLGEERRELEPGTHFAEFVPNIFSQADLAGSVGAMTIASDQPIAAVTLLQVDDPALSFPNEVPTLTAFPVLPGRADAEPPAAEARLAGDGRVLVELDLSGQPPGLLAVIYRVYRGERSMGRFVREAAPGRVAETLRLPAGSGQVRVEVQLIYQGGRLGRTMELRP